MKLKFLAAVALALSAPSLAASTVYSGFDASALDLSVRPGDDFYRFANGRWIDRSIIPQDRTNVGLIASLSDRVSGQIQTLLESLAAHAESPSEAKLRRFYQAFMNERRLADLGSAPLRADLARVRSAQSRASLANIAGSATESFAAAPFALSIDPDGKDPTRYAVNIDQSGLGLPDRDYYTKPQFGAERRAYRDYMADLLTLAGWPNPQSNADAILSFEGQVARVSWTAEQRRDPNATYRPISRAALERLAPGFEWRPFFDGAELRSQRAVVLEAGGAIPAIARVWRATPLPALKAWEAFHIADSAAPFLSPAFDQARFAFRGKVLTGQQTEAGRSRRTVDMLNARVGELLGRAYVRRYFSPQAKAAVLAIAKQLKVAFRRRLQQVDWLSPATKDQALEKLDKLTIKIGYPDRWRSYDGLLIRSDDLYGDVVRSRAFDWRSRVRRLGRPVDRSEWLVPPQSLSAYSNPQFNEIAFPAAKLQPPYFDSGADDAVNYGAIGAVIGHEMTHGFDDQGRAFDAEGRLRDWWTPADSASFKLRAGELAAQYSSMEPLPGIHIRGAATLGENIADLGGLLTALDAYRASHPNHSAGVVDRFSGDQRVLLGWAQIWRAKWRPEALQNQIETDEHAPFEARVNGVVRNMDDWYELFDVKPTDRLFLPPAKRVRIW
jgi:putative endopeptidase